MKTLKETIKEMEELDLVIDRCLLNITAIKETIIQFKKEVKE